LGGVHPLRPAGRRDIGAAVAAYLATLSGAEQAGTRKVYGSTLRALAAEFPGSAVGDLDSDDMVERLTDWFTRRWSERAPATWNRNLDAVRGAARYWQQQEWVSADPSRRLRRRSRAPDRTRSIPRGAPRMGNPAGRLMSGAPRTGARARPASGRRCG
jgi:site-specific recombinase XerD